MISWIRERLGDGCHRSIIISHTWFSIGGCASFKQITPASGNSKRSITAEAMIFTGGRSISGVCPEYVRSISRRPLRH
jgi:hypothetical protein